MISERVDNNDLNRKTMKELIESYRLILKSLEGQAHLHETDIQKASVGGKKAILISIIHDLENLQSKGKTPTNEDIACEILARFHYTPHPNQRDKYNREKKAFADGATWVRDSYCQNNESKGKTSPEQFLRDKYKLVDFHDLTLNGKPWIELMEEYAQSHANKDGWVSCAERLPELIHTMGCGNKYSEDVLITNGEDSYVAYLEAVRPTFEKKIWTITVNDDMTVKDHTGKDVTHWKKITPPQI